MFPCQTPRVDGHGIRLRVAVMGAAACGKTSFLKQYLENIFQQTHCATVGETHNMTVEVEGEPVDLEIWDTPGGRYFEALRMRAIQNCDAFLLVYAMDDIVSFGKAIALHEDIIEMRGPVTTIFIGTKADLKSSQWLEKQHQMSDFVSQTIGHAHHEVSAKTGSGISLVFVDIVKQWQKGQEEPKKSKIPKFLKNVKHSLTMHLRSIIPSWSGNLSNSENEISSTMGRNSKVYIKEINDDAIQKQLSIMEDMLQAA